MRRALERAHLIICTSTNAHMQMQSTYAHTHNYAYRGSVNQNTYAYIYRPIKAQNNEHTYAVALARFIKSNLIYFSIQQGQASTCKVLLTCMPIKKV